MDYLLDSCKILKDKKLSFKLIVAGGKNGKYFKKRIANLGLSSYMQCLGVVKDVEKVYYASDFFIYPTLFDAFGYVVLESLACGTPSFCSTYAGASEVIDNKNFIIENPTDVYEIADKMLYAIENKDRWQEWRKEAITMAKQNIESNMMENMEKSIKNCFKDKNRIN